MRLAAALLLCFVTMAHCIRLIPETGVTVSYECEGALAERKMVSSGMTMGDMCQDHFVLSMYSWIDHTLMATDVTVGIYVVFDNDEVCSRVAPFSPDPQYEVFSTTVPAADLYEGSHIDLSEDARYMPMTVPTDECKTGCFIIGAGIGSAYEPIFQYYGINDCNNAWNADGSKYDTEINVYWTGQTDVHMDYDAAEMSLTAPLSDLLTGFQVIAHHTSPINPIHDWWPLSTQAFVRPAYVHHLLNERFGENGTCGYKGFGGLTPYDEVIADFHYADAMGDLALHNSWDHTVESDIMIKTGGKGCAICGDAYLIVGFNLLGDTLMEEGDYCNNYHVIQIHIHCAESTMSMLDHQPHIDLYKQPWDGTYGIRYCNATDIRLIGLGAEEGYTTFYPITARYGFINSDIAQGLFSMAMSQVIVKRFDRVMDTCGDAMRTMVVDDDTISDAWVPTETSDDNINRCVGYLQEEIRNRYWQHWAHSVADDVAWLDRVCKGIYWSIETNTCPFFSDAYQDNWNEFISRLSAFAGYNPAIEAEIRDFCTDRDETTSMLDSSTDLVCGHASVAGFFASDRNVRLRAFPTLVGEEDDWQYRVDPLMNLFREILYTQEGMGWDETEERLGYFWSCDAPHPWTPQSFRNYRYARVTDNYIQFGMNDPDTDGDICWKNVAAVTCPNCNGRANDLLELIDRLSNEDYDPAATEPDTTSGDYMSSYGSYYSNYYNRK